MNFTRAVTKKNGFRSYLDYCICICLGFYLISDSITGFLLAAGGTSVSTTYKLFILVLMVLSIASKNINAVCFTIFMFLLMFVCLLTYTLSMAGTSIAEFLSGILKLISNQVFFIYFFYVLKSNKKLKVCSFGGFLKINSCVFAGNILAGLMGFGFYTYNAAKIGIKGFFFAGNEVAVLFYCLYYIFLVKIKNCGNKILIVYLAALVVSILIATKTGVLACILISGIDYYLRLAKKRKFYFKLFFPLLVFILASLGIYFLPKTQFYQFLENNIKRSLAGGGNIVEALFSGRIGFLRNNYIIWKYSLSPGVLLFGLGPVMSKGVEIDFFDVLFVYGVFFTVLMMGFYFFLVYLSAKKRNYRLFFFNLIYIGISFIAGHVWTGVSAGLFYAYINAYELS